MSRMKEKYTILDVKLGNKIDELRVIKGLSQARLADALGISHQQIQKNLKGTNRISASKIPALAQALNVTIESLFYDINDFAPAGKESDRLVIEIVREVKKFDRKRQLAVSSFFKSLNKGA